MDTFSIFEDDRYKILKSLSYNYQFNKQTGFFVRYGEIEQDDPEFCPFGPEILDLEVSTVCHGLGKPCRHCYKSNTSKGKNMSFKKFKAIFDKMPRTLTQIAFGIGDISSNPDLFKMFDYCRNNDRNQVVPNITINGWKLTDELAEKLASLCGAVAVSKYENKDVCYDAVAKLNRWGLKQVNIHHLVSEETYLSCFETIEDACKETGDERLIELNAIVFLMLKQKGRGKKYNKLDSLSRYKELIDFAFKKGVSIGFDSCSAGSFLRCIKDRPDYKEMEQLSESCESTLFSSYINVDGVFFPCSFTEGEKGYGGVNVLKAKNFLENVWFAEETKKFREKLISNKCRITGSRECPAFDLTLY